MLEERENLEIKEILAILYVESSSHRQNDAINVGKCTHYGLFSGYREVLELLEHQGCQENLDGLDHLEKT